MLLGIDHQLCQHASEVVAEGCHGVDGMGRRRTVAQTAALSFPIKRYALAATLAHLSRHARVEHPLDSRSHIGRVKPRKQPLDGGLMGSSIAPKA